MRIQLELMFLVYGVMEKGEDKRRLSLKTITLLESIKWRYIRETSSIFFIFLYSLLIFISLCTTQASLILRSL